MYFFVFFVMFVTGLWAQEEPLGGSWKLNDAIRSGDDEDVVDLLEDGAPLGIPQGENFPPLHEAARRGNVDVIKGLLYAGAPVDQRSRANRSSYGTALHEAVLSGSDPVVRVLLGAGADINAQDRFGNTSLHLAIFQRNAGLVSLLIGLGANINQQDVTGATPLYAAVDLKSYDIVRILLEAGARVDLQHQSGGTVLHRAIENTEVLLIELFIHLGADLNAKNAKGDTPLLYAIRMMFENLQMRMKLQSIITMLVKAGARLDVQDSEGYYPLHLAVLEYLKSGDPGLLYFLTGLDLDINVPGPNGDTPLHLLLRADDVDRNMVQEFIDAGADLNQHNNEGESPQDIINATNAQAEDSDLDTEGTDSDVATNPEVVEQGAVLTVRPREAVFTQAEIELSQPLFQVRCLSLGALM